MHNHLERGARVKPDEKCAQSGPSGSRGGMERDIDVRHVSSREQIRIPRLIRTAAKETLRQNEAIQAVLLYGSRSRGDHRRGSDYDIAIVTSLPRKEAFEAAKLLYDGDLEKKYWTELVFRSPKELERYANTAGTLESRLAREGVLIAGEWTRPECREGTELDIEIEKALEWADVATWNGSRATSWLDVSSSEGWPGDNVAATRVQRMAEQVTKGILATFGIYETDIHDLDGTADELANAYLDNGWKQSERSEFGNRIRGIESKGRAAVCAEKRKRTFEPLDETIGRLGRVWSLLIAWLEMFAKLYPEAEKEVAEVTRRVDRRLSGIDEDPEKYGASPELIEHVQRTRAEARQLGAKLQKQ